MFHCHLVATCFSQHQLQPPFGHMMDLQSFLSRSCLEQLHARSWENGMHLGSFVSQSSIVVDPGNYSRPPKSTMCNRQSLSLEEYGSFVGSIFSVPLPQFVLCEEARNTGQKSTSIPRSSAEISPWLLDLWLCWCWGELRCLLGSCSKQQTQQMAAGTQQWTGWS